MEHEELNIVALIPRFLVGRSCIDVWIARRTDHGIILRTPDTYSFLYVCSMHSL